MPPRRSADLGHLGVGHQPGLFDLEAKWAGGGAVVTVERYLRAEVRGSGAGEPEADDLGQPSLSALEQRQADGL